MPPPRNGAIARRFIGNRMPHVQVPTDLPLGRRDLPWLLVLALVLTTTVWATNLRYGTLIRGDLGVFFVPYFEFLGSQLRQGRLPAWNPHQFAGAPFIGDPGSGWGYLLAMLPFLMPNLVTAVSIFMISHVVLGGLATFLLARLLGLGRAGSAVAAVGYAASWLIDRSSCCPAWVGLAVWFPVVLIGVELAARQSGFAARLPGWIIAALALTQIATSWMGQGLYYVLLVLGAFCLFRALAFAQPVVWWKRIFDAVVLAAVPTLLGGLLGAFVLIPMLDVNSRSTLARGQYDVAVTAVVFERPLAFEQVWERLFSSDLIGQWWYVGGAVFVLAAASLFLATGWCWRWFLLVTIIVAIGLSVASDNAVLEALYQLLPGFRELHGHQPYRALMLVYLPLALLAGGAVDGVFRTPRRLRSLILGIGTGAVATIGFAVWRAPLLDPDQLRTVLSACAVLIVLVQIWFFPIVVRFIGLVALLLILVWDPLATRFFGDPVIFNRTNSPPVSLQEMSELPPAARWLRDNSADGARFVAYDDATMRAPDASSGAYRRVGERPDIWMLMPNDLATLYGLDTVQGYNPSISRRYSSYIKLMNGVDQEYHETNVFPNAFDSPLLDLLGARFVVTATQPPGGSLILLGRTVYADNAVMISERVTAFPRAWLVNQILTAPPGQSATLMEGDAIDYRTTAVVESPVEFTLGDPGPRSGTVTIQQLTDETIRFFTTSDTAALLVVGQSYDPGWTAWLEGKQTPVLPVNEALTGVVVPAGSTEVELRYQPPSIRTGAIVSLVTVFALASLLLWDRFRWRLNARGNRIRGFRTG